VDSADQSFHKAQHDFRIALCDSFNTPAAIAVLIDIIGKTNVYFARSSSYNIGVIETIALWVSRMLRMFGLGEGENLSVGWGKVGQEGVSGDVSGVFEVANVKMEAHLDKYIRALSSFRDDIRKLAIGGGSSQDILALCDRFRDQNLVNLGVQLDDGQGAG
jgi:cysteinyl-tRNA synthetase